MNRTFSTLIVDDDVSSRLALRTALQGESDITIVGEACSVSEATRLIAERKPDVIFLDINLPCRSGFELLPNLPQGTRVIFVTAFDEFAVHAFELHALDYMLKPLRRERLQLTLDRLRHTVNSSTLAVQDGPKSQSTPIMLHADGEVCLVSASTIAYVKAVGNYSQVHFTNGGKFLVRRRMEDWRNQLPADHFCRVHRSLIINLRLMRAVRSVSRDEAELKLEGCPHAITLGRRASLLLRRLFKQFETAEFAA